MCVFSLVRLFVTRLSPTRLICPWGFLGKNPGVVCHFPLQEIFPTHGSRPHLLCLLHCRWILYLLSHWGSLLNFNRWKSSLNMSINIILLTKLSSSSSSVHKYISFLCMDQAMLLSYGKENVYKMCINTSLLQGILYYISNLWMFSHEQGGKILGLEQL